MSKPFAVEEGDAFYVVEKDVGWLSFIARYTRFPEPRRERDGYPVLVPAEGETLESLRPLLRRGILWPDTEDDAKEDKP